MLSCRQRRPQLKLRGAPHVRQWAEVPLTVEAGIRVEQVRGEGIEIVVDEPAGEFVGEVLPLRVVRQYLSDHEGEPPRTDRIGVGTL